MFNSTVLIGTEFPFIKGLLRRQLDRQRDGVFGRQCLPGHWGCLVSPVMELIK